MLGWILFCGAIGYVLNGFVSIFVRDLGIWGAMLPIVAAVGEFWMIGPLLWTGFRAPLAVDKP